MAAKLANKIAEILSTESPLTLKEIVQRVMDSGWEPPRPKKLDQAWAVVPYVSQALVRMTRNGVIAKSPNREGRNQYFLEKKDGNG